MTGKLTLATEADVIIRDEHIARAAEKLAALDDAELRRRARATLAANAGVKDGDEWPDYLPPPELLSREEVIPLLAEDAGGNPPTFAIDEDDDDPLILDARDLRRDGWERDVAATIKAMELRGKAAARHIATAEQAELEFLRRLVEETWELPEADLRLRAVEFVGKLAGGTDGDKEFPYDPDDLSRGELLAAIASHINRLRATLCETASVH